MSEQALNEITSGGENTDDATSQKLPSKEFGPSKNDETTKKKKKICKKKKWTCEDTPLWRIFMNSYLDREKKLQMEDKFDRRKAAILPNFSNVKSCSEIGSPSTYASFPLNTFNLEGRARLPDKLDPGNKIRLWKNMRNDPSVDTGSFLGNPLLEVRITDSGQWPGKWPCIERDLAGEMRALERMKKRKMKGLLPCQEDSDDENDPNVLLDDFADHKELGHARVPVSCPSVKKSLMVDRASGPHPGLVDGDYILFVFGQNDEENRTYADVCLRGLKGMHLAELSDKRVRQKTWKYCFYQAVVALLAKTQLRYKFAWSVNIDYIFDHAWMLFVHMGSINVKDKIRLDDIVVYNYKYSVELELVHEMKDGPRMTGIGWNYAEKDLRKSVELARPELTKTHSEFGWEKPKSRKPPPVHELTRAIEKWFDELDIIYRNCILRTSKFSIAFWQDGNFWYTYNPYRCDKFGMWHDAGYACIVKYCSKVSLRRHLMILILRAYAYRPKSSLQLEKSNHNGLQTNVQPGASSGPTDSETGIDGIQSQNNFNIQIFRMIYHCVQIHNVQLVQRKPTGPAMERAKAKEIDDCGLEFMTNQRPLRQDCFNENEDTNGQGERPSWLTLFKVTWARFASSKMGNDDAGDDRKLRWHRYYVEEPLKVFSLWGEIHPTGHMFARENHGKQVQACYVVSAGMTRIQAPEYWSPKTLDAIVMCGDRYLTMSREEHFLRRTKSDEDFEERRLGENFKIGDTCFEVDILEPLCGRLYEKSDKSLWKTVEKLFLEEHFAILSCESSCLGIFKFCGSYYMLDVNSFGPPIFQYGDGVGYLIRATTFRKFMKILILTIGSNECSRFSVTPIVITNMIDLGNTSPLQRPERMPLRKPKCPYEDDSKAFKPRKRANDKNPCKKTGCGN